DRRQVLYVFDLDIDHDLEEIGRAVVILRLLMLPPCLPIVVVRLPRLPGSLAIVTLIRPTWAASASSLDQATSSQRSGSAAKLSSVSQSIVWIVTPLPVVTMPTIRSPGSGWQQPAKCR